MPPGFSTLRTSKIKMANLHFVRLSLVTIRVLIKRLINAYTGLKIVRTSRSGSGHAINLSRTQPKFKESFNGEKWAV